ncbi:MAG TPA: hypothetical protein PLX90_04895, partial [Anaerolineales bacterium]|nr:hypothetical protein [Anaerolineales bacterium]
AWNGMNNESVIYSGQQLLLQVTPPPTLTPVSTATVTPTLTLSPSPSATFAPTSTPLVEEAKSSGGVSVGLSLGALLLGMSGFLWWIFSGKRGEVEHDEAEE